MIKSQKKLTKTINVLIATAFILLVATAVSPASAATNLIKNGSFESDMYLSWGVWQDQSATRQYQLYRSFDVPYANGSYAAAIEAKGAMEESSLAMLISDNKNNNFTVSANKTYYLIFYTKGSGNFDIPIFFQNTNSFAAITPLAFANVTTDWQKNIVSLTPTATSIASLCYILFNFSDMTPLWLDGK